MWKNWAQLSGMPNYPGVEFSEAYCTNKNQRDVNCCVVETEALKNDPYTCEKHLETFKMQCRCMYGGVCKRFCFGYIASVNHVNIAFKRNTHTCLV